MAKREDFSPTQAAEEREDDFRIDRAIFELAHDGARLLRGQNLNLCVLFRHLGRQLQGCGVPDHQFVTSRLRK
jgi:hypothetical protein